MTIKTLAALGVAFVLAACSTTSPDVVSRHDAQRLSHLQDATVLAVRGVTVAGTQSGAGGVTGGLIGGLAGSSRSSGRESVAIGVLGALAGAVAGNAIERAATKEDAVELVVQLASGTRHTIVQANAGEQFRPGDKVVLITTNGRTRVTLAPVTSQPAYKPEPIMGNRN